MEGTGFLYPGSDTVAWVDYGGIGNLYYGNENLWNGGHNFHVTMFLATPVDGISATYFLLGNAAPVSLGGGKCFALGVCGIRRKL